MDASTEHTKSGSYYLERSHKERVEEKELTVPNSHTLISVASLRKLEKLADIGRRNMEVFTKDQRRMSDEAEHMYGSTITQAPGVSFQSLGGILASHKAALAMEIIVDE